MSSSIIDDALWECGNPFCGFPHFHTPRCSSVEPRCACMGPWAEAGRPSIRVVGARSGPPRSMSFAPAGWRHLRDDHPVRLGTQTALTPPSRGSATRRARPLRRRQLARHQTSVPIPPHRIQNPTEPARQARPPQCGGRAAPPGARPTRATSRSRRLRQHAHAACTSRLRSSRRPGLRDVAPMAALGRTVFARHQARAPH